MDQYVFIWHPGCSTCKRARAWLEGRGVAFVARDIRADNPTADELAEVSRRSGRPARKLFNTSGQQYRALGVKERLPAMSEAEQFALLASDGMLVKRPLLLGKDLALVGFRESEWNAALTEQEG